MICTLIVPAYNEEPVLGRVLEELLATLPAERFAILVVDDGSTDGTAAVAARFQPRVTLLRHKRNYGYGASIKTGVLASTTEYLCLFDADGQHDPADVERLLAAGEENDMVVGARNLGGFRNLRRAPGKLVLHMVANLLAGRYIPDLNSGLRLFRREVLTPYLHLLPDGFSASTTSTMILLSRGYLVEYIPIQTRQRVGVSQVRQLRDGAATLLMILRMVLLFRPVRFFSLVSAVLILGGSLYGLNRLMLAGSTGLSGGSMLIILLGVLFFIFGLLTDQIASLRLERFETPNLNRRLRHDQTRPGGDGDP